MKQSTQATIIYLEKDEEITSVIDRLVEADEESIILIVPDNALLAQSSVNLKLLKREAQTLKKSLILVTQDEAIRRLAHRIGLEALSSLEEAASLFEGKKAALKIKPALAGKNETLPEKKQEERRAAPEKRLEAKKPAADILEELIAQTKQSQVSLGPSQRKVPPRKMADVIWPVQPKKSWRLPFRKKRPFPQKPPSAGEKLTPTPSRIMKVPSLSKKALIVFFVAAFLLLGLVLFFVLPKAEVQIIAKKNQISTELQAVASRDISKVDLSLNKIPAQVITIDKSEQKEFPTTGQRQLNEKTRGVITVYNAYSSSPQTLVETTRFISKDGKLFRTTKTIIVPGARVEESKIIPSTIDVEVVADQPGPDYNIGPSDFTIPGFKGTAKYAGFYGKSKTAMSGGATGTVKTVAQDDLDKAKESLSQRVFEQAKQELYQQIPSELQLLDSCFKEELAEVVFSHKAGDQAENFALNIKVSAEAILFSELEMTELVRKNILAQISQNQVLKAETLTFNYLEVKPDFDKWQISFKLEARALSAEKIEPDQVKKEIMGKDEIEVRRIFGQMPEIESVKVTLWPFWVKKIPTHPSRVQIKVE